ncbi:putative lipid II flippase FtsW [Rickettsiella grylli]|uniref:Probable peptidoglycan glycosyltransferase FtsW n=1 Tax=Rickettsiella grylli TaxID=59196 RepID=A8PL60_9COXI|nr:putative lipid II flippase FtsW [Rickettsiella grylli]EDP45852.1 cell division protein FtsW [Rickettsiella grylli]
MPKTYPKMTSITLYDRGLLLVIATLLAFGLLMVASSSIVISEHEYGQPFHFFFHQLFYLTLGIATGIIIVQVKTTYWQQISPMLLVLSIGLLFLVLLPGIGRQVNGSIRWLGFGPFGLQVSEFAKLTIIVYLAGYLVRQEKQVKNQLRGFIKPLMVLTIITFLLLREPDFGAATVILLTSLGMLFLAGVRIWHFSILLMGVAVILAGLAISSPYRLARLTTFLNPWANQFDSGYQLTQSLIAFGRGSWLGVGLGESIQKLFYLPEAHTDFLFAVLTEELGLIGGLFMILLFSLLVWRALTIGYRCFNMGQRFSAYLAYGIGLNIALQVMINIGVNTGVLPTKGLTLPLMSYGGSSLLITCIMLALLLRIDHEYRLTQFGFRIYD